MKAEFSHGVSFGVEATTDCPVGGDHGRTEIKFNMGGCVDIAYGSYDFFTKEILLTRKDNIDVLHLTFNGDWEANVFIEALEWTAKTLRDQYNQNKLKGCLESTLDKRESKKAQTK